MQIQLYRKVSHHAHVGNQKQLQTPVDFSNVCTFLVLPFPFKIISKHVFICSVKLGVKLVGQRENFEKENG